MSWERDPLWAKAKLFFDRAFSESREGPVFGLWCSLGLELLGRAALSSVSPTLLAEPDREHKYLLHALNRGSDRVPRKSITSIQVFTLCKTLFSQFTEDDFKLAVALINRRNEELHSGAAAFEEYKATKWLASFYKACSSLCSTMEESLVNLFGEEEARVAEGMILENRKEVLQHVTSLIGAHRKVFEGKSEQEREKVRIQVEEQGNEFSLKRYHRVTCPACRCIASVQGITFGKEKVDHENDGIVVRQAVSPTNFECQACGLRLSGYAELEAASLGGQYTRRTTYTPEEYYGLINPDDLQRYVHDEMPDYPEYDNE